MPAYSGSNEHIRGLLTLNFVNEVTTWSLKKDFRIIQIWVQILLIFCVTLGQLLNLSEPLFLPLEDGEVHGCCEDGVRRVC